MDLARLAFLLSFAGLLGFWVLSLAFLFRGREGISGVIAWFWVPGAVGASVVILSLIILAQDSAKSALVAFSHYGMFGAPILVPLTHMLLCVLRPRQGS
jgi:hypothetical protein